MRRDTGECRHVHAVETIRSNADGQTEWVVGTSLDVTDRKNAEEHIRYLMGEVNHRSKNLLGVVTSIAKLSAKNADPAKFAADLSQRIVGLSACQDLLVCNEWKGVDVADLVRAELSPYGDLIGNRILLTGPRLLLCSKAAQGIGMALHELATNAAKYGALSNADGRIHIDWGVDGTVEPPKFMIHWLEDGGPKVAAPKRKGFGQKVIVSMMENIVKGKVEVDYRETGVAWKLISPAQSTLEAA